MKFDLSFYKGKRVFVTGHTGFKGAWMCAVLIGAGAEVTGYALQPPTDPSLFALANVAVGMHSIIGDIRDGERLVEAMEEARPEIAIHMAAQPLVRDSYSDPVYTFETNVMGTVHFLEAVRQAGCVRSVVNVTTDKVYKNREWEWGYRETDELNGYDPYSNSKSCSELVTSSYINAFFKDTETAVSTMRAGNVIGGGDFANDRIVPDCVRAVMDGQKIAVRNPYSTRPYQHVLEPVTAYLHVAQEQYGFAALAGCYNVGPDDRDCVETGELAALFCDVWGAGARWENVSEENAVHEANFLKLDCSKIKKAFGIRPVWDVQTAISKTVEWSKIYAEGGDIAACMKSQIKNFMATRSQTR